MRINRLTLNNYRHFEDVEISFSSEESLSDDVTVFIGNNGAGKTTILRALSLSLSWMAARIARERASGSGIKDLAITNGKTFSTVKVDARYGDDEYSWTLAKNLKGRKKVAESQLSNLTELTELLRSGLSEDESLSLPLLAYYPVERIILDIPLKIRKKHSFAQLDGLDGSLQQGVDFRRFFEWFREREDAENEQRSRDLEKLISNYDKIKNGRPQDSNAILIELESQSDSQLRSVRSAINQFMPQFDNLRVERKPRLRMMVDKDGKPFNVEQLSQGEKSLMALVGSIASRLSMMNPSLSQPLEGRGIIMIDEIDLHLHPKWQREIINNLRTTFPNCQFILTTHSPLVISNTPDTLAYVLDDGEIHNVGNLYGMDVNQVLLQEMDVDIRNQDVQDRLDDLLDSIHGGDFEKARSEIAELEKVLPADHWELNKIQVLLLRKEALCAKDS